MPQGSILGLLLFLVYVNDMLEAIRDRNFPNKSHENNNRLFGENCDQCGQIILYADDAIYQVANKHRVQNQMRVNKNLARLEMFMTDNDLAMNNSKTALKECMIKQKKGRMSGNPPHLVVKTDKGETNIIEDSKHFRVLGANLQENMGWRDHLERDNKAVFSINQKTIWSYKTNEQAII